MGWLEILAVLQKFVPLLTRAVPMLEVFVASRTNTAANDEVRASIAELGAGIAGTTASHQELADAVAANTERLGHLSADLLRLRSTAEEQAVRLESSEKQVAAMAAMLRLAMLLLGALLFLSVVLIYLGMTRHG